MNQRNSTEEARDRARELRKSMSKSHTRVWEMVRSGKLGVKFRREVAIGPYFLDLYCHAALLAIEVDGEDHGLRLERDLQRDQYLAARGIYTLRIPSLQLWESNAVRERIVELLYERVTGYSGPPEG